MTDSANVWAWDVYPLAADACENARVCARDGEPLELYEQRRGRPRLRLSAGDFVEGPARPVRRKGYRPTADDLAILRRVFPDGDPANPSWTIVEAELIAGGHPKADIDDMNAPTLVRLLGKVRGDDNAPKETAKGGRPGLSETERQRRRDVAAAWEQAKAAGVSQKDFARDQNMTYPELTKVLNWCAKNRQRTDATA